MVARNFFLLLLNCSAWPCLGPAQQKIHTFPSYVSVTNIDCMFTYLRRRKTVHSIRDIDMEIGVPVTQRGAFPILQESFSVEFADTIQGTFPKYSALKLKPYVLEYKVTVCSC